MSTPAKLTFHDFELRAWRRDRRSIDVLVHASPAGSMARPIRVPFTEVKQASLRIDARATMRTAVAAGRALARALLPPAVYDLFTASLRTVSRRPGNGLRLRLVLDESLTDVPWEFLYRPETAADTRGGFFVADPLISIVRGVPWPDLTMPQGRPPRRLVFTGALWDGRDEWDTQVEFRQVRDVLSNTTLAIDVGTFIDASDRVTLEDRLRHPFDLFHYSGHCEARGDEAVLVTSVDSAGQQITGEIPVPEVAARLAAAGVRFAVFNGCNTAHHAFVGPFVAQRLPAFVAVSGIVFSDAAIEFSSRMYEALLVGLTIDEAVTHARLQLLTSYGGEGRCDWGTYAVYQLARDAVLFPAPASSESDTRQARVRSARATTVSRVRELVQRLDGDDYGVLLSDLAARGVLILGRFTESRLSVLEALKRGLASHPAGYKPILFTFERPKGRDLLESVATFAGLARFVVADISDASMVREELLEIVPNQTSLPVVPLIESGHAPYTGFTERIQKFPWVTPIVEYREANHLLSILETEVIERAERIAQR